MRRRRSEAPTLNVALLHHCATGEVLDRVEGEQRYPGRHYNIWAALCDLPRGAGQRAFYARHGAEIEQHARTLGLSRSWLGLELGL